MIPFFEIPAIPLGPVHLQPFGILVAAGMMSGYFWLQRRVKQAGGDAAHVAGFVFWMLAAGFAGAVALKLLYVPDLLTTLRTAPGELLRKGGGIASFGGLFAGLAGGCVYLWTSGLNPAVSFRHLDALAFVFPRAWLLGRIGCALTHDHPGIRTDSWLAVQFPDGPRYDLGLLEALFTLTYLGPLAVFDRRERPAGFYLGLFLFTYGLFRLALDRLHEDPVRYFGWTVDQYASAATLSAGGILLVVAARRRFKLWKN